MSSAPPPSHPFIHIDTATLQNLLAFPSLISHFHTTLPSLSPTIDSPTRVAFPLPAPSSRLLLMPAWSTHPSLPYLGLKAVTSYPTNSALNLAGVHASYSLFHSPSGLPLASLDGSALTVIRTAAVSALAAKLLSNPAPKTLAIAGAGALAPHLVAAHISASPSIARVLLWNRTNAKASSLAARLRAEHPDIAFETVDSFNAAVEVADIISCATSSTSPVVEGRLIKPGAHLDLVGSFTPAMRECDDEALVRGRVFVDFEVAMEEAGELVGAVDRGVFRREDVAGTLAELAGGKVVGRRSTEEITVFKSVGTAVVDLLAAQLAYESYINR